jgi:hypothetical protein
MDFQSSKGKISYRTGHFLDGFCINCDNIQVLAVIGENFTYNEEISGIVVSIRAKQNRICIWTKIANDQEKVMKIG